MVIDLKVFLRNLNYENRVYYIETLIFLVCENKILFHENFIKIKYYNYYMKICYLLLPGDWQEKGTRECE